MQPTSHQYSEESSKILLHRGPVHIVLIVGPPEFNIWHYCMQVVSVLPLLQTALLLLCHRQAALPSLRTALLLLQYLRRPLPLLQFPPALSFSRYHLLAPQAASPTCHQSLILPPGALQVKWQFPSQLLLLLGLLCSLPFSLPIKARPSWQKPQQLHQQQAAALLELLAVVSHPLCCPL